MDRLLKSPNEQPNLHELAVELRTLRSIMDERDRLYTERGHAARIALEASIHAIKEQTALSFAASEKAIQKAEEAQREYNIRSNEFRGQLEDQAQMLMPRAECAALFKAMDEKLMTLTTANSTRNEMLLKDINGLREAKSNLDGRTAMLSVLGMAVIAIIVAWVSSSFRGTVAPNSQAAPIIYSPAPPGALLPTTPPAVVPR